MKIFRDIVIVLFLLFFTSIVAETKDLDSLYGRLIQSRAQTINVLEYDSISIGDNKCGFSLIAEIKTRIKEFSLQKQSEISKILSRPVLSTSIVSPKGLFRIHFDETGTNKPGYDPGKSPADNAALIAEAFDSAYSFEINYLGYPAPPADNGTGGDDLYDVYLIEMPSDNYGDTSPEDVVGSGAITYIRIDNNFAEDENFNTFYLPAAQVTAAHEFFHAVQIGMVGYPERDTYFFELTATSMEEFVFDTVNDYYYYIHTFFNNMSRSFSDTKGYDLALWNIFLQKRYGFQLLKRQWELIKQNNIVLNAIGTSLTERDSSLTNEFHLFGIWCYLTNYRAKNELCFEEAKNYPLLKHTFTMQSLNPPYEINTKPMSQNYLKFLNMNDQGTYKDTIVALITNCDITNAIENPSLMRSTAYSLITQNQSGYNHVVNNYFSKLEGNNEYFLNSHFFNNELVGSGIINNITETSYSFPSPFSYSKNTSMFIPVAYNQDRDAKLYIYSSDMELIYSGYSKIKVINNKFVVEWNGMSDNKKLPTGVYLYITDSGDKLTKGKIVIYND